MSIKPKETERVKDAAKSVKKDIGMYSALEAIASMEGGQLITSSFKRDIIYCIDEISSKYKKVSHLELMGISAELSEKLAIYRLFSRASKNKKLALIALQDILDEVDENEE